MTFEVPDYPSPLSTDQVDLLPQTLTQKVWFATFPAAAVASGARAVFGLLIKESHWRDMLALTWYFRTFSGGSKIKQFLTDRHISPGQHSYLLLT